MNMLIRLLQRKKSQMSKPRLRTTPDLSLTSPAHQVENKDFSLWSRNVIDEFKPLSEEKIKAELKATAFPYAVVAENWSSDFNFATLVRNANAFNAREIFYLGDKKWDKRGAQGTNHYSDVQWLPTIDNFLQLKERYAIVIGIDNIAGAIPIHTYRFPKEALIVFGSEGNGLTPTMQSLCDLMIEIPMFGSVRSLNCGCASAIIMHLIVSQMEGY